MSAEHQRQERPDPRRRKGDGSRQRPRPVGAVDAARQTDRGAGRTARPVCHEVSLGLGVWALVYFLISHAAPEDNTTIVARVCHCRLANLP
jgi:hypothetical protein